jgi:hypothetical protein
MRSGRKTVDLLYRSVKYALVVALTDFVLAQPYPTANLDAVYQIFAALRRSISIKKWSRFKKQLNAIHIDGPDSQKSTKL